MALSRPKHGFESRWGRTPFHVSPVEQPPVVAVERVLGSDVLQVLGGVVPCRALDRDAGEQFVETRRALEGELLRSLSGSCQLKGLTLDHDRCLSGVVRVFKTSR